MDSFLGIKNSDINKYFTNILFLNSNIASIMNLTEFQFLGENRKTKIMADELKPNESNEFLIIPF